MTDRQYVYSAIDKTLRYDAPAPTRVRWWTRLRRHRRAQWIILRKLTP